MEGGVDKHFFKRHCPVAFGEALAVGVEHEWHVDVFGRGGAQQRAEVGLAGGGIE